MNEEETDDVTNETINESNVATLRKLCGERKLTVSGTKLDLQKRLRDYMKDRRMEGKKNKHGDIDNNDFDDISKKKHQHQHQNNINEMPTDDLHLDKMLEKFKNMNSKKVEVARSGPNEIQQKETHNETELSDIDIIQEHDREQETELSKIIEINTQSELDAIAFGLGFLSTDEFEGGMGAKIHEIYKQGLTKKGLQIGMEVIEINGKSTSGKSKKQIMSILSKLKSPCYIIFQKKPQMEFRVHDRVEVMEMFKTDSTREEDRMLLHVGDILVVQYLDEEGDITVNTENSEWENHKWIFRMNFDKLKLISKRKRMKKEKDSD